MHNPEDKIRLLVVDDEREFLDATSRALERRGFFVRTASNGKQALDALLAQPFEVVVLDVKMPGPDGVEVFRKIKNLNPDLPVIMLTGHGTVQQAFETSRHGVSDYLTKPCDMEHLAGVVNRAVAKSRLIQTNASETADPEPIRVLLVDDEADFLESLSPALERRGMRVATALSSSDALEKIGRLAFDVAVIDLRMPGADGIDMLRRIGNLRPLTQVILLTGQPSMDKMAEAMREHAFAFMAKPQTVEALTRKIREAYAHREQRAQEIRQKRIRDVLDEYAD